MVSPVPVDILIVDDNEKNLLSLEAVLGDLGASLVRATSGDEALLKLLEQDFALILLDIQMPNLDGFETAKLIRSRDRSRHVPIIFLTAFHRSQIQVHKGYELGAVDFLFKPIVPEVLRAKVAVFIELHRKGAEIKRQAEKLREAELREHERVVVEARQRWEKELLREEVENERRLAEVHAQRVEELAASVAKREEAQEALRASHQRLLLLGETANVMLGADGIEVAVDALFERLARVRSLEMLTLHRASADGQELRLEASKGLDAGARMTAITVRLGEHVTGRCAADRKPVVVSAAEIGSAAQFSEAQRAGVRSWASFPLLSQGRLLGTIGFGSKSRDSFDADELATLQAVADQMALAVERSRLVQELRTLADDLRDRDRRKDEFLAMLGHELRNPLAPILNAVQVLTLLVPKNPPIQRALAAADRQVRHMARLVDDLLDVSRITTGKIELRRERVDLRQIIDGAVQTSEQLVRSRAHEIAVLFPGESLTVEGDPTRLAQIVSNLINNAAKYTDTGGHITVRAEGIAGQAVLSVADDGVGIAPEMLDSVFELFVQADRSADRSLGGLGIGLTLVKRLVEMHGGEVRVTSAGLGKGSTFEVRLPLAEAREKVAAPVVPEAKKNGHGLRIAIVEDNEDIRSTLRDLLELHGHTVTEAGDGPAGVNLVLTEVPDVALVDIGLPGADGYEVANRLRAAGAGITRLVALTGYGTPDDRRKALAAGFDAHLAKPIDLAVLSRLLQELV
jgi:signal transduction histidine kinase/DNA-binding response OmpR family regulator